MMRIDDDEWIELNVRFVFVFFWGGGLINIILAVIIVTMIL